VGEVRLGHLSSTPAGSLFIGSGWPSRLNDLRCSAQCNFPDRNYLDGYDLNVIAPPGQTAHLTFVADRAGDFRFRCSVTCGALHPFMIGKLNVGPNWLLYRAAGLALLGVLAVVWVVRP
jgi:hypothetical protein